MFQALKIKIPKLGWEITTPYPLLEAIFARTAFHIFPTGTPEIPIDMVRFMSASLNTEPPRAVGKKREGRIYPKLYTHATKVVLTISELAWHSRSPKIPLCQCAL